MLPAQGRLKNLRRDASNANILYHLRSRHTTRTFVCLLFLYPILGKEDDIMATAKKLPSGSWRCQVLSHTEEYSELLGNKLPEHLNPTELLAKEKFGSLSLVMIQPREENVSVNRWLLNGPQVRSKAQLLPELLNSEKHLKIIFPRGKIFFLPAQSEITGEFSEITFHPLWI